MPRNGSGVYSKANPSVVTQTTIESSEYNSTIDDIVTDLNTPRPIAYGGTAAATAAGARTALDVAQRQPSGEPNNADTDYGLVVGSFGLGGNAVSSADFDSPGATTKFIRTNAASTPNAPSTADSWSGLSVAKSGNTSSWQLMVSNDLSNLYMKLRARAATVWGSWMDVRFLISTTTTSDGISYRYSDGLQVCTTTITTGTEANTAIGNMFETDPVITWTFPQAFSTTTGLRVGGTAGLTNSWLGFSDPGTTNVTFQRFHPTGDASTRTCRLWAEGTWR